MTELPNTFSTFPFFVKRLYRYLLGNKVWKDVSKTLIVVVFMFWGRRKVKDNGKPPPFKDHFWKLQIE